MVEKSLLLGLLQGLAVGLELPVFLWSSESTLQPSERELGSVSICCPVELQGIWETKQQYKQLEDNYVPKHIVPMTCYVGRYL